MVTVVAAGRELMQAVAVSESTEAIGIATKNDKIENLRARGKILVFSLDDGGYSNWGAWSRCSETCGKGSHTRTRTCTSPPPSAGGKDCSSLGPDKETGECDAGGCPGMITRTTKIILFLFSFFVP